MGRSRQQGFWVPEIDEAAIGKSYVPILLLKPGECHALEGIDASTAGLLTPYLRVVPPEFRRNSGDETLGNDLRRVARVLRAKPVYLDALGAPRRDRRRRLLPGSDAREIYELATDGGLAFVPVYPFRRPDVAEIIRRFTTPRAGAAVLVTGDSAMPRGAQSFQADLRDEVRLLGVSPSALDVVVDLRYLREGAGGESAVQLVRDVAKAVPWRSIVVASTSVPDTIASVARPGSLAKIPRGEIPLFRAIQSQVDGTLRFADYGVQNPLPPRPGPVPQMHASIRYSSTDWLLVSRGARPLRSMQPQEKAEDYRVVADRIRTDPLFVGSACCWGDRFIDELVLGRCEVRGQHMMRAIATCHHLTVTAALWKTEDQRGAPLHGEPVLQVPS